MSSAPNPKLPANADKLKPPGNGLPNGPEEPLWSGKYSGKAMVGTWLVMGLVTIAAIVAYWLIPALQAPTVGWVLLIVLAVAWIVQLLLLGYRKLSYFYELTNQRLKHRDGILIRHHNRVEVIDIDDVTFRQGIIETMFNVGTLRIRSSDASHPELLLPGISNVKYVADLIDSARRNERTRRGLYVENI